jgi:hypothetical protein
VLRKQNEENDMMWGFVVCTCNLILLGMKRIGTYRSHGENENSLKNFSQEISGRETRHE